MLLINEADPCAAARSVVAVASKRGIKNCSINAAMERDNAASVSIERIVDEGHDFDEYFYYKPRVLQEILTNNFIRSRVLADGKIQKAIRDRRVDTSVIKKYGNLGRELLSVQRMQFSCSSSGNIIPQDFCCCDPKETKILQSRSTDLDRIPYCTSRMPLLRSIDLGRNHIAKIENLDNATILTKLELFDNTILKIEGLKAQAGLETLNLSSNKIARIESMSHLAKLWTLNLRKNRVSKIDGLSGLSKLAWLDLSENRIRKLEGVDTLHGLENLNLIDNNLSPDECDRLKEINRSKRMQVPSFYRLEC